jgi:MSHA biogenesis protein MshP
MASAGFVLPSAIFLLVILAGLAAFLVNISITQSRTSAQDVQGARAYHAARAGIDWGLYTVLDPANATVVAPAAAAWPSMPACPADTTLTIEGFSVLVHCDRYPAGAVGPAGPPVYLEGGSTRSVIVYQLSATASIAGALVGTSNYVERQVSATVSKCRALDGVAPGYECS